MTLRSRRIISREEVVAESGVVATKHRLETDAGIAVLQAGGNAVDAAVAVSATGWVVEPWMTCAGGVGFLLFHEASTGATHSVDFPPRAPAAATPDLFPWNPEPPVYGLSAHDVDGEVNSIGPLSVAVPGTVAGIFEAHRRWGRLPLADVLAPAISLAENGFEADWQLGGVVASRMANLRKFEATARQFLPGGVPHPFLAVSTIVTNHDLAGTLRTLAADGADAFYRGDLAEAIADHLRDNGGLLSRQDLADYRPEVGPPMRISYRGFEVLAPTGPGGHWTELQTLKILENTDLRELGHNSVDALHTFIEAIRHAFADRFYYLADAEFEAVPLDGLLSEEYARTLAELIAPDRTSFVDAESPAVAFENLALHDPWPFDSRGAGRARVDPRDVAAAPRPADEGHTTNFSIIDDERNVVVCTQTAGNLFGSMVTVPGTGILLNDGMVWFNPKPGTANSVAGGKRPLVNMGPMIVLKDGHPVLGIGAPGGQRIISSLVQVLSNVIDHGMSIQDAVAAPRVDCSTDTTYYDDRIDEETIAALAARGHRLSPVREELNPLGWDFAHPTCVMIDDEGRVRAGVDVFRPTEARGY